MHYLKKNTKKPNTNNNQYIKFDIVNARHLNCQHLRSVSVHKGMYLSSYSVCTQTFTFRRKFFSERI